MWWLKKYEHGDYHTICQAGDNDLAWFRSYARSYMRSQAPGVYFAFHDPDDKFTRAKTNRYGYERDVRYVSKYAEIERRIRDDSKVQ